MFLVKSISKPKANYDSTCQGFQKLVGCQKKNIVKLFFSQNELGLQQNEVIDDISEENQTLLKQANDAKSRELETSRKVEKIQKEKFELKSLVKTHKDIEHKFVIDKQDMLEQIEELKSEVTKIQKESLELKSLVKTPKNVELNDKDKQGQKQIEGLKKEVTDLKSKLHKSKQDMLKQIEESTESLKEELNVKRNFDKDKQDILEQIEGLKKEAEIGSGDLFLLCQIST